MDAVILGDGLLGRAIAGALAERGDRARLVGRPAAGHHDAADLAGATVAFDASRGPAVAANMAALLDAGVRRIVIATTAWDADRRHVERLLVTLGGTAVAAPNLSLGVALFGRLVEEASRLFGQLPAYDPYLVEWHRRGKPDRPSGTARDLAGRIASIHPGVRSIASAAEGSAAPGALEVFGVRAGANPGSHLVGFDGPGELVELRITSRDRSAYAAGALAAADWLAAERRSPGLHPFDRVVDDLLASSTAPRLDPSPEAAMAVR